MSDVMNVPQVEAEVFSCFTLFLHPILPQEALGPPARPDASAKRSVAPPPPDSTCGGRPCPRPDPDSLGSERPYFSRRASDVWLLSVLKSGTLKLKPELAAATR